MRRGYFCYGCYVRRRIDEDKTIFCQKCNRNVCEDCKTDVFCYSCDDLDGDKESVKELEQMFNNLVDLSIVENIDKCKKLYHLIRQNRRFRWIDDILIKEPTDITEN